MVCCCVCQEDEELLCHGEMDSHASLAVRLRRAEKKILHNVTLYSASQKASASQRCQQSESATDDDVKSSFHISSLSTVTGEQEFVRIDSGTPVYGTDEQRAASDAEFFESARRGDYQSAATSHDTQPDLNSSETDDIVS